MTRRVFISDLHLEDVESPNFQRFQELIQKESDRVDEIFILGDLMEMWVGDDDDADIVVSAVGKPNLVTPDWIKPGAIVIDVGITRDDNNKLHGDVMFDEVKEIASWITPVPGGVGPMTRIALLENTLLAAKLNQGIPL